MVVAEVATVVRSASGKIVPVAAVAGEGDSAVIAVVGEVAVEVAVAGVAVAVEEAVQEIRIINHWVPLKIIRTFQCSP